jgi:hypothetical protein
MAFPGYSAPSAFVLDAGVIMVGSTVIGATRGGMAFDPGMTLRHVEFDGKTTDIAGLHRIVEWNATISGDMLDTTDAAIGRYFAGSSSDGSANNLFTMKAARDFFVTGDYLSNLIWKGQQSDGTAENLIITFARALVEKATFKTNDRDEGMWSVTFKAVLDVNASDLEAAPFTITKAASANRSSMISSPPW